MWRPATYEERRRFHGIEGRFRLSLTDEAGGVILVASTGEVGGIVRRVHARVVLASPLLGAALHAAGLVQLGNPPGATVIVPYGDSVADRRWAHLSTAHGVWFESVAVSLNAPGMPHDLAAGPADPPGSLRDATAAAWPQPARLVMAPGALITLGQTALATVQPLRAAGVNLDGEVRTLRGPLPPPEVDREYYQGLAAANLSNAAVNQAAGAAHRDDRLERKQESLYSPAEFARVLAYLRRTPEAVLRGTVYVRGGVALSDGDRVRITGGTLVTDGTVHVVHGGTLEIVHDMATRSLAGLLVLEPGAVVVSHGGRLRVHGLVYAGRTFDAGAEATVDSVGAVLGADPRISIRNHGARVVIRYDPAVMGTPGLRVAPDSPVVAWVTTWEERP
ncbi:MAG: hypothetical protein QN183_05805 [Armatimonadota bacterium]|nr:hypothetical protein [Armatimonadota bacterium]MDR7485713.1 hypothetical protein [Armatimonadota bacterium]MDR7533106.1 hypothetical protein [Armatimonadota bacterium]MDR7535862.1 hypothetical protein [Armatimonadota bacterium]